MAWKEDLGDAPVVSILRRQEQGCIAVLRPRILVRSVAQ